MVSPDSVESVVAGEAAQAAPVEATPDPALTALQEQVKNLVSNGSKREGELTRERDAARKALELGPDSDEYRTWEKEQSQAQGASEANERAAYWQMRAEFPTVPEGVYSSGMNATQMENAALRYQRDNPVASGAAAEAHPAAPAVATGGGGGGAPTQTDEQRLANDTKIKADFAATPNDPVAKKNFYDWRRSKGR